MVVFRFSGESGDEGGADGDARNGLPDIPEQRADIVSVRYALHGVQHIIGNMLEGNVYIAGHFGAFRDGCGQFVAPVGGVGVEQPDPEFSLNGVQSAEQGSQGFSAGGIHRAAAVWARIRPFIHAVIGDVLRDEADFLHAGPDKGFRFTHYVLLGTAAVASADHGNDAVGAAVVAAFRYLDVGRVRRGKAVARRVPVRNVPAFSFNEVPVLYGPVHHLSDDFRQFGDLVRTDKGVHLRKQGGQFLPEALGQAARHDEFLVFRISPIFPGTHDVQNGIDGFLLGLVNESAGIDHHYVREFRFRSHGHAGFLQVADHDFRVNQILGAAQGNESNGERHGSR